MKLIAALAAPLMLASLVAHAQPVELEFLNGLTPPEIPPYQAAIDAFNKANPDIHVTQTNSPWTEFWQQLQVRTAAGTMPDVWRFVPGYGAQWLFGHQLLDITPYVKKDPGVNLPDANQTMLKYMTLDGKLYGIGYDFNGHAVFYNPDLFDKAGVPYPKDGWTTEDLAKAARTISQKLSTPNHKVWGYSGFSPDYSSDGWYRAFGATMITDDGKYGANNDAGVAMLSFFADMIKDGAAPIPDQKDPQGAAMSLFLSGNLAMKEGAGHDVTTLADAGFKYGLVKLPVGPAGPAGVGIGGSYVIDVHTPHPEEAYRFLSYITSGPVMAKVVTTGIPARNSAMQTLRPDWRAFAEKISGTAAFNAVNGSFQVMDIQKQVFANVWNGTEEPAAALADAAKQADAVLTEKAVK